VLRLVFEDRAILTCLAVTFVVVMLFGWLVDPPFPVMFVVTCTFAASAGWFGPPLLRRLHRRLGEGA
jgi:hypothetical protein